MLQLVDLIIAFGYIGITLVVFAESGLFFGFFLPGDSLLFTAGLFAARGDFNIFLLLVLCFLGATIGDSVGYTFGKRVGPKLFTREESFFFKRKYIDKTRSFYEKHGNKTLVLARFMPIVRTFAPIMAGVAGMQYGKFLTYNLFGGALWVGSMLGLGYFLGAVIPDIDRYVLPIIAVIIIASVAPPAWHAYREWKGGELTS